MEVTIQRTALLKPLQMISGVVEKKQTFPILANVLMSAKDNVLLLTATDLEMECVGKILLDTPFKEGAITVSARKLLDICKALPENAMLTLTVDGNNLVVRAGRSRFLLTTLPAKEFPSMENAVLTNRVSISPAHLKNLLGKVYFAMGQQDVRPYLNGTFFELNEGVISCVATDGHRLAYDALNDQKMEFLPTRLIFPRKSVLELMRLLDPHHSEPLMLEMGENHVRVNSADFIFTSKLINTPYPDYDRLIPKNTENVFVVDRESLKQALMRVAILSNEKARGILLQLKQDALHILANNPEQEEAEEIVSMNYSGSAVEIGFNVAYLLDVVSTLATDSIRCSFSDPHTGVLIEGHERNEGIYVIMPTRL